MQEHDQEQAKHAQAAQQQLTALQEQLHARDEQVRKMAAQSASQQASANYIIQQLQTQLDNKQCDIQAAGTSVTALHKHSEQQACWSIQEATARVAQVLQTMTSS